MKRTYYALVHPDHGLTDAAAPRLYVKRCHAVSASKQTGSDTGEYAIRRVTLAIPPRKWRRP